MIKPLSLRNVPSYGRYNCGFPRQSAVIIFVAVLIFVLQVYLLVVGIPATPVTVQRRNMKRCGSRCCELYRVIKKDWNWLKLLMNSETFGSLAGWRNDDRNDLLWCRITKDVFAAVTDYFNWSLPVMRFEVLTNMWPENSTYSLDPNCVFSFVCSGLFNNVVSNLGHT
jgi:hypothetical protein